MDLQLVNVRDTDLDFDMKQRQNNFDLTQHTALIWVLSGSYSTDRSS